MTSEARIYEIQIGESALRCSIFHWDFSIPSRFDIGISSLPLVPVVSDGLDRAAFLGLFTLRLFLRRTRLFIDERIAAIVVAFEIVRSGFATQVAINALV